MKEKGREIKQNATHQRQNPKSKIINYEKFGIKQKLNKKQFNNWEIKQKATHQKQNYKLWEINWRI